MLKEFKQFALKGNVLDLAIAVIIGSAFSKIVSSLVKDIIMPLLGLLMGGINFSSLSLPISLYGRTAIPINFGLFIQAIIDFLIVAFSLFIFIKAITSVKKKKTEEVIAIKLSNQELLLTEIRDLLKEKDQ
jgi:large conductance mechanosensitive channel